MDHYVRETRQVTYEAIPVDYIPGSFSLWRQSGQRWSYQDYFIYKTVTAFCYRQNIPVTSIEVIASLNERNPMNVINVQTRLTAKQLHDFLYNFEYGTVTFCGRLCSLQPTRVHNSYPFSASLELQPYHRVTPPYQLNSVTLILQGGNPPHWRCPLLAHHANSFANSLGLPITDVYVMPYRDTLAVNIYFAEPFETVIDLCSFILRHTLLNTENGPLLATVTLHAHLYSVQPTMPLTWGDTTVNRKEHDLHLLTQWANVPIPRLLPPRSLSPRRSPPREGGHGRRFSPHRGNRRRPDYF